MSGLATALALVVVSACKILQSDESHRLNLYTWTSPAVAWWQDGDRTLLQGPGEPQGRLLPATLVQVQWLWRCPAEPLPWLVARAWQIHPSDGSHRLSLYIWASLAVVWWQDGD